MLFLAKEAVVVSAFWFNIGLVWIGLDLLKWALCFESNEGICLMIILFFLFLMTI